MLLVKRLLKLALILILLCLLYLGIIILWGTITDYQPEDIMTLEIEGNSLPANSAKDTLAFLSWNIGFCGLGAEMDFFYDGGNMVHPSDELVKKYTKGITDFLSQNDNIDFILLQEVDKNSARTNHQNEIIQIAKVLPDYSYSFAENYKVKFVPIPFTKPLGKIEAGQITLSGIKPIVSERYAFFAKYSWPKCLFMLDRCFINSCFALENGKQLVVMNTHNSAYDVDGKLRQAEMPVIRDLMLKEYEKGNYVVAGGDWNQNPPDFDRSKVDNTYPAEFREILDQSLFPEDWHIVYDPFTPTNREIDVPLTKGKTTSTIIDYYILSPNIEALKVKTFNLNFQHSDHHPVFLRIRLM